MAKNKTPDTFQAEPGYYSRSRSFAVSIISVLPLIVLYHCGIVQSGYGVRNMAEVWLGGPLHLLGLHAAHVVNVLLILGLVGALWRSDRTGAPVLLFALVMAAEGGLYALVLLHGGQAATSLIQQGAEQVVFSLDIAKAAPVCLALGAGVYEELLFRLLMMGGGAYALRRLFLWNRFWSLAVTLVASSLLFSAAHHVGPMGESFDSYNFLFRAVCGMMLGLVFALRGLGVAVWTHAIYNALVVL